MFFEMNEYDEYLESADELGEISRDVSLERAECQMAKMVVALESAEEMYDLNLREAELKVYAESGTDSDLMAYCEAAQADLDSKTGGILMKLWKKVAEFFTMLKEKLLGKKGKALTKEDKVSMPKPVAFALKKVKSLWSGVKSTIASGKKKLSENNNWKKLVAVLIGAATVTGGGMILHNVIGKKKKSDITEPYDKFVKDIEAGMRAKAEANGGRVDLADYESMSGVEFEQYSIMVDEITGFISKYGEKMYKGYSAQSGVSSVPTDVSSENAKELSRLGSLIKPIVNAITSIHLKKAKAAAAGA